MEHDVTPQQPRTLLLYQYIDGYEARAVAAQLQSHPAGAPLHVHLHSPGGEVHSGLAIYNLLMGLRQKGSRVVTVIDGLAASMASVIAMAGEEIRMAENAELMIHNPWTMVQGDSQALRSHAEHLDQLKAQLVDIYASRTGRTAADIASQMDVEQYLSATEAKAQGFVDTLIGATLARAVAAVPAHVPRRRCEEWQAATADTSEQARQLAAEAQALLVEAWLVRAQAEGRIQPGQEDVLRKVGMQAPDLLKALLATLEPVRPVGSLVADLQKARSVAVPDARAHWTLRDWEKRDPKGLARLRTDTPEAYRALFEATYRRA